MFAAHTLVYLFSKICFAHHVRFCRVSAVRAASRPVHFCTACRRESFPSHMHPRDKFKTESAIAISSRTHAHASACVYNQSKHLSRAHTLFSNSCARTVFTTNRQQTAFESEAKHSAFLTLFEPYMFEFLIHVHYFHYEVQHRPCNSLTNSHFATKQTFPGRKHLK